MFKYDGEDKVISAAVFLANSEESWQELYEELLLKESFDMSTISPILVYEDIKAFWETNNINIKVYYPRWRWSKAIGYFTEDRPLDINLNGYKLNRTVNSFMGTFFHELVHMSDYKNKKHSYGHGSNNSNGKQNTAPYFIGNVFSGNFKNDENYNIKYYTPWWKRVLFFWR